MADKPDRAAEKTPALPGKIDPASPLEADDKKPFPTPAKNTDVKSEPPANPALQGRPPEPAD